MKILITGGTGFVGWHVVRAALKAGHTVVSLSRGVQFKDHAYPVSNVKVDLVRPQGLGEALHEVDAVVHAAGILREEENQNFERAHVGATENLVEACREAGVGKIVLMSALGARKSSDSGYLLTKFEAEEVVQASDIPFTIFRPSLVFGDGDRLVSHLIRLLRYSPVVPVPVGSASRIQPIWVGDVARAVIQAIGDSPSNGRTFELGGPVSMSFEELVEVIKRATGRSALNIKLPEFLSTPFVRIGEQILEDPPLTRRQLSRLSAGGTCDPSPAAVAFGLRMRSLADVVPEYENNHQNSQN